MKTNKRSYKLFWLGFSLCLLLPLVFFLISWQSVSGATYADFPLYLELQPSLSLNFMLFCILPDLVVLFVGYKSDKMQLSQGGILGVLPYFSSLMLLFF